MKRIILATIVTVGIAGTAMAAGPLSKGAYCYPTSPYWHKQLANPWNAIYYAAHPEYAATYGPTTHYCI